MATVKDIYRFLDEKAPFCTQLGFDNAGFLVGKKEAAVTHVLVALDITEDVIFEAINKQADLIVSHHPVIWGKISSVTDESLTGKKLLMLMEHKIAAICAHTNLDAAEGGVNTRLAELLNLHQAEPLHVDGLDAQQRPYGIGRVGVLLNGPVSLEDFAGEVKKSLNLKGIRVYYAGRPVKRVAVGGGACGSMLSKVIAHGCDTFVTAELKHDVYLEAQHWKINLLDAGHYSTETVICSVLRDWLQAEFPELLVQISACQQEVFDYL